MAHVRGQQPQRLSSGRVRRVNMEPGFQTRGRYSKKRKKTVLVLGVAQMILGLVIIGVSFSVFALTSASRIRHASPCWAGFALLFTGGVGVIAWRQPSSLSLGFYTVLSCLCILLHLVATTLAGLGGMELQSVENCMPSLEKNSCLCCTSIHDCTDGLKLLMYAGTTNCHMLEEPVLRNIMFANCVTNIVAIVLCITTSSVGFILALKRRRTQRILSRGYANGHHGYMNNGGICSPIPTGDAHDQFSPIPFLPPPYAPPQYNEISNDPVIMQSEEYPEENAAPHIIIDPGELPPPYSTLDYNHVSRNGRRSSRSSRGNRSSRVLENPHSGSQTRISSTPVPPSHISRGCSTDTPPLPPVRWDSHRLEVQPFCLENQTVTATIAMGRGLVTEYPGQELVTEQPSGQTCSEEVTVQQNNLNNPELYITENPLVPLAEAKTPLQIHMATRCPDIGMYLPEDRPNREAKKLKEPQGNAIKQKCDRGRRSSHTGSRGLVATDGTRPKKEGGGGTRVKRRRSRRTRSLQSASSGSSRQYSSSSDSEEERQRATHPRRKPHKTCSNSEGRECSDCRLPSTTSESTINRDSGKSRSKSGSDMTSFSRESVNQGLLCSVQLASSERLTPTDNSSLEERLMALRQSYESLTASSTQGTLVDTSSLRPNSLGLTSGVKDASVGSSSPNSEFSNPWILRSRSNTSEGVSFASSSITLTSETSGASSEMKYSSDITCKKEPITTTMQNGLLPPLPVSYRHENVQWSETKTPLILDNDTLPLKEDNTLKNCLNDSLQSKLSCLSNLDTRKDSSVKPRPKSVAEVNHETRVGLKQLLMEIEEDVESPIKTLLTDIQGMLKSDQHCLVDLQHSANIVNHFLNQKETNVMSRSLEKLHISNTASQITSNTAVLKSLESAKETVL